MGLKAEKVEDNGCIVTRCYGGERIKRVEYVVFVGKVSVYEF